MRVRRAQVKDTRLHYILKTMEHDLKRTELFFRTHARTTSVRTAPNPSSCKNKPVSARATSSDEDVPNASPSLFENLWKLGDATRIQPNTSCNNALHFVQLRDVRRTRTLNPAVVNIFNWAQIVNSPAPM